MLLSTVSFIAAVIGSIIGSVIGLLIVARWVMLFDDES